MTEEPESMASRKLKLEEGVRRSMRGGRSNHHIIDDVSFYPMERRHLNDHVGFDGSSGAYGPITNNVDPFDGVNHSVITPEILNDLKRQIEESGRDSIQDIIDIEDRRILDGVAGISWGTGQIMGESTAPDSMWITHHPPNANLGKNRKQRRKEAKRKYK